ncbi:hypothetical protein HX005_00195 [Acinetobacter sp. R933-2]|uniref:hypothetical protein n=1 Tax=Acinetobacter sp. R933-2 TaxID=2746728 RepID=UPI0025759561|nr:hypothetical protein [Acinetobacter sp. R933-2]MDM1245823.1 hypothetical protein [Acinetobacter sp. R933-2]
MIKADRMKATIAQHFFASCLCMFLTAIICAYLQNKYSVDRVSILVFALMSIVGLVFSITFAFLQKKLKQNVKNTVILTSILAIYLVLLNYFYHVQINDYIFLGWQLKFTFLQKIINSAYSFWLAYLVPFMISFFYAKTYTKTLLN